RAARPQSGQRDDPRNATTRRRRHRLGNGPRWLTFRNVDHWRGRVPNANRGLEGGHRARRHHDSRTRTGCTFPERRRGRGHRYAERTRTAANSAGVVIVAAAGSDAAAAFIEVGAVALVLAALARLAGHFGFTAIPLYLVAGLAVGEGGLFPLDVSHDFIQLVAEIGVLLLLLTLGLEYSASELQHGLRSGWLGGVVDAVANFSPGFAVGLALGWTAAAAVLLGGVSWVSSSGIISKVLSDLDRLGNRETPSILNLLVIEDLAMAVFLPVASALVIGRAVGATAVTIAVALAAVSLIMVLALRFGDRLSAILNTGGDEALLLAVFGLTLVVGGLAQKVEVSAAIGAFLVGLALSGPVQQRAGALVAPLRDLFAAVFFVFFSF